MIEGIDYELGYFKDDIIGIVLLQEPFKNVKYHYDTVNISEESDMATLHFDYTIIDNGLSSVENLESLDFKNIIGDILVSIISRGIDEQN